MSQVHSSLTCHEPYYAPVPQVDRGHQGHLGAGDRHHVLVIFLHYCQVEERRTALVQIDFILNCNRLKSLLPSSISIVLFSKTTKALMLSKKKTWGRVAWRCNLKTTKSGSYKIVMLSVQRHYGNIPYRCPLRMVHQSDEQSYTLFIHETWTWIAQLL